MEIDTANNMERFSTGSGADEAVEVHDFEIVSLIESNPKYQEIQIKAENQTRELCDQHSASNLERPRKRSRSVLLKL